MDIRKQMTEKNFAEVDFGATSVELQRAIDAFDGFLSLPPDIKSVGDYKFSDSSDIKFGYFRREAGSEKNGRAAAADTKHVYHFGSNTRQAFESNGQRALPSEVREFCDHAESIYWLGVACLRSTLDELHASVDPFSLHDVPNMRNDFFDPTRLLNIRLRFVGYDAPTDAITPISKGHFDRSVFTLPLAETAPGLEIGRLADGSDLVPVAHSDGKAKFMAGKGWGMMPDNYRNAYDFIHPAYHQARNLGDYGNMCGPIVRHVLVLFANSINHSTDPPPSVTRPTNQPQAVA